MGEETKHTAGPWVAERCDVTPAYHIEAGAYPFGTCVCEVMETPRDGSAEANAHLISAAPELLAALKAVISVADRQTTEFDLARAAIAKAEGRCPQTQGGA